jgi:hypothetical protein
VKLLSRGVSLLPREDPSYLALALELGEALGETDEFGKAEDVLREVQEEAAKK